MFGLPACRHDFPGGSHNSAPQHHREHLGIGNVTLGTRHALDFSVPLPPWLGRVGGEPMTSCGCVEVEGFAQSPGLLHVSLAVKPGSFQTVIESNVLFADAAGNSFLLVVTGSVMRPFEGWPSQANVSEQSGRFALELAPDYAAHALRVEAYSEAANAGALAAERHGTRLWLPPEASEVVIRFGEDAEDVEASRATGWSGPLVLGN